MWPSYSSILQFIACGALVAVGWTSLGSQPNVVLILIDDLCHHGVSAYGATQLREGNGLFEARTVSTPSIDRLASEGLRCDYAFAYPLCEPTRIALMTGQHNSRNFLAPKSQHASDITFGDLFQRAGYATGVFGKWKQTRGTPAIFAKDYIYEFGWDEFCCFDVVEEGARYINPNLVINGAIQDYSGRHDVDPHTGRRWYGPDIVNRHALDFVDRHKDEPFFLYYPMVLVHDEHTPTPDSEPSEVFDHFPEMKYVQGGFTGDDRRFFPDMLAYMDKLIGKLIDKLEEHNLRQKTLVVLLGDNGTKETYEYLLANNSTYPGGKGCTRDNGLHVPLILSQPGTILGGLGTRPRVYSGLIDVTDILPTICEAAHIDVPKPAGIDGVSFWKQTTGADGEHRSTIYTWYNANRTATDSKDTLRYAFDKSYKLYAPHADFSEGRFFDLTTDPLERAGDREVTVRWGHTRRNGLNIKSLSDAQRRGLGRLQATIDALHHMPVERLELRNEHRELAVAESMRLHCEVFPPNATRRNLIWKSGNSEVATVDKFGNLSAVAPGEVTISVYSWDDAMPLANGSEPEFERSGITSSMVVRVN